MTSKTIYPNEVNFEQASKPAQKGVFARWVADVLARGQSLRYLESLGGL